MGAFEAFDTREAAAAHVAALLEGALRADVGADTALTTLFVSGGSTPAPVFQHLSCADLAWGDVTVGLVDERWVEADDPRSNAGLVRGKLLTDRAAAARFIAMKTSVADPFSAVAEIEALYAPHFARPPIILLGMGADGHTASWFPGASGLEVAMEADQERYVAAIDAAGAPVAGDMPHRMTLTARAIATASLAILHITGQEKRAVLEHRDANLPIHHAERLLGPRLKTVWSP